LVAVGSGCTRIQPPLTPPETGGASWRELVSPHIVLRTDRDEADAREALVDLEQTYVALHDIAFPQLDVKGSRIVVIHFDRQRDFEKLEPSNMAGIFHARLSNDLYPEPTMVVWGKLDASARQTLQHELTHMFARSSLGVMPVWFSEGLAQYYETFTVEDGFAYIGRPLLKMRAWASSGWKTMRQGAFMTMFVPIGYVPEVQKLTAMDPASFYVWTDKGRQPLDDEVKHQTGNYLGAFGLTHMVLQDAKYQPRFDKLMDLIGQAVPFTEAWASAFQGVDADQLETDYRQHLLNKFETMILRTPYKLVDVKADAERTMPPADVHLLWARLRPWRGADLPAAKADVDAAVQLAPTSPDVLFVSAEMHLAQKQVDMAAADITAALAARPDDERFLLGGLAIAQASAANKGAAPNALVAKQKEMIERLARVASSGAALDFLARQHELQGDHDEALAFAKRAVKSDATCVDCYATLGDLLFERKDYPAALHATEVALSLLPDGVRDESLEAQRRTQLEAVLREGKKPRDTPAKPGDSPSPPAPSPSPSSPSPAPPK
jgi:tetratricopeptide (TPR) repeat protein